MPQLSRRVLLRSLATACGVGAAATVVPLAAAGADRNDDPEVLSSGRRHYDVPELTTNGDNTQALNDAFAAAQPGDTLVIPPGDWSHSDVLRLPSSHVTVDGYGARLLATGPRRAGLHITGSSVTVRGLTHEVVGAQRRGNGENLDDCPFSIDGGHDVVLQDVVSVGARDAGMFLYGARRARLIDVHVRDSLADGIHLTNGSTSCIVESPVVLTPGDDGIAVVSYADDAQPCSGIRIDSPLVINGQGRGIAISGGDDIHVTRVDVRRSRGSGVYVASESGQFDTTAVTNCRISGGSVDDANWDPGLDTGNVGVFQLVDGSVSSNVIIEGLTVTGSQKTAEPYIKVGTANGSGGRFDGLQIRDVVLPKGHVYVDGSEPTVTHDGAFACACASGGSMSATGSATTDGPAAVGQGIALTRIRR